MQVIVMRGVPGAGKTWWQEQQYPRDEAGRVLVCSANLYFTDSKTGEYKFRADKLYEAHGQCLRQFVRAFTVWADHVTHVIVDNTNIAAVEMAPYIALAEAYGARYEIVRVQPRGLDAVKLAQRCVHNVPAEKIGRMMYAMKNDELPRFWARERVVE